MIKRNVGLFKKAYKLGVLCSVDVAVIIFEYFLGNLYNATIQVVDNISG